MPESNRGGWHCQIASQMFGFLHHHSLFPFHQRPLTIPSTDSPKAVPAAALLNARRNILTAYTFENDGMETIMDWRKDWWGNPCSSCTNLHWPLTYQAAVPMFPWADFFPIFFFKKYLIHIRMSLLISTYETWKHNFVLQHLHIWKFWKFLV